MCCKKFLKTKISSNDRDLSNGDLENMTVKELNAYTNPENGRLDIWLQSINDLKASTVNDV